MKHSFNEYAKAFVEDAKTAIPRLYRTVFNNNAAEMPETLAKVKSCAMVTVFSGHGGLLGAMGGVVAAYETGFPPLLGLAFGAASGAAGVALAGLKIYTAVNNLDKKIDQKFLGKSYTPVTAEAFPEVNKLRKEDRGMNP